MVLICFLGILYISKQKRVWDIWAMLPLMMCHWVQSVSVWIYHPKNSTDTITGIHWQGRQRRNRHIKTLQIKHVSVCSVCTTLKFTHSHQFVFQKLCYTILAIYSITQKHAWYLFRITFLRLPISFFCLDYHITTCNSKGRYGPSPANCTKAYSGTKVTVKVIREPGLDGVQKWIAPRDGYYT